MSVTSTFNNSKKLFLIDGIGAIISATSLGVVLVHLQHYVGIPTNTLYFLATLPCLFAMYDFFCYFKVEKNINLYLKGIAIINFAYCALSIGLTIYHSSSVTFLGWMYIILEVIIVLVLATLQFRSTRKPQYEKAN